MPLGATPCLKSTVRTQHAVIITHALLLMSHQSSTSPESLGISLQPVSLSTAGVIEIPENKTSCSVYCQGWMNGKNVLCVSPSCLLSRKNDLQQEWPGFHSTAGFVVNDLICDKKCCLRWSWPILVRSSFTLQMARCCGQWRRSNFFCHTHTRKCHDSCLHQDLHHRGHHPVINGPPAWELTDQAVGGAHWTLRRWLSVSFSSSLVFVDPVSCVPLWLCQEKQWIVSTAYGQYNKHPPSVDMPTITICRHNFLTCCSFKGTNPIT